MPRVDIPIEELDPAGTTPPAQVVADATNDHEIDLDGDQRVWLEVENVGASSRTVTIHSQLPDVDGLAFADRVVTVPAGEIRLVPLKSSTFAVRTAGTDFGKVYIDPEVSTDLEFRAYRLPRE